MQKLLYLWPLVLLTVIALMPFQVEVLNDATPSAFKTGH